MSSYQVALPVFQGPLDLLLHLIERQELDITQVSLAHVTGEFLAFLAQVEERDLDGLSDFLVVAAKLILIKSRVLLPRPPAPIAAEEPDEGEDLVQQLIEYRRFKEAARWLKELEAQGFRSYVRLATTPRLEHSMDLGNVTLDDLLAVVRKAMELEPVEPSVNGAVAPLSIRIADRINAIARATALGASVSFRALIEQANGRLGVIVTLLAVLEMIKQGRVTARQDVPFGDVVITGRENGARTGDDLAAA